MVIALVLASSTIGSGARAESLPNCTPAANLVNPCRPLLGAFSSAYPGVGSWRAHMTAEETRIARPLDIVHDYHSPGVALVLTADEKYYATRPGTTLLANWKPANRWADAGGSNAAVNAQIDLAADSIKSIAPAKIMITIHHEPEQEVSPGTSSCGFLKGNFGSPADYRAMWRNIEERFAARGVTNVVWVMNYMGYVNWDCLVPELWPGNDLVDWVMYNPYDSNASSSWSSSVSRFYNVLTAKSDATHDFLSKPWGLEEFGVGGSTTQAHAYAYYDAAKASVERNEFPRLKAYVAFDTDGVTKTRTSYSVAGVYDAVEQQHFNAFANSPVFTSPDPPPPDTTPPTVTLTAPGAGDTVHDSTTVRAATDDDVGVTSVTYSVDDGPETAMTVAANGTATASWDTTSVTDGEHSLVVRATDAAGNSSTASGSATVANADTMAPSTPTGLRTRSVATDNVTLGWDPATDDHAVTGYRLTRDGTEVWSGTGTTYADATVEPGGSYRYQVAALDAAGHVSPDSAELQVPVPLEADTTPPSTPELSAHLAGDDAELSWSPAEDDTGVHAYDVFRNGDWLARVDASTTTYTDGTLATGQSYAYAVQAVDQAGNAGALSEARQVTTRDTTRPSAPTQLTGLDNPTLGGVYVNWAAASDNVGVTGYSVSRGGVVIGSATTPGYLDTTVAQGAAYDYTVTALDAAGNTSDASAPVRVTTADRVAPAAPAKPTASLAGGAVTLTWPATTDNVGVQGYRVRRNGADIASVTGTSYRDAAATQGANATYTVVAYDAANNTSAASPSLVVAVPDTTAPAAPAKPTVTLASGKATVTWPAASDNIGVVKYGVRRDGALMTTTTGRTYTDSAVVQGRTYSYTLTAYDAANNVSAVSPATALVVPDTTAPAKPATFTVVAGVRKATLTWSAATDNVGVTGYEIWRGSTRLNTTTATSYSNGGLVTGSSYAYKVRAYDAKGNLSAYTAVITVKAR